MNITITITDLFKNNDFNDGGPGYYIPVKDSSGVILDTFLPLRVISKLDLLGYTKEV